MGAKSETPTKDTKTRNFLLVIFAFVTLIVLAVSLRSVFNPADFVLKGSYGDAATDEKESPAADSSASASDSASSSSDDSGGGGDDSAESEAEAEPNADADADTDADAADVDASTDDAAEDTDDAKKGDETNEKKAEQEQEQDSPHPERPDSRNDPDVGEPGADLVEGINPAPPGVLGLGDVPADRSKPVNPPEVKVQNCKSCPKVEVPEFCGYAPTLQPGSLGAEARRRLLASRGDGDGDGDGDVPGEGGDATGGGAFPGTVGGRRGLLAAKKGHQAFQAADRKLSTTRQPDFKPPSDAFRREMVKIFKSWRDEDQCTMWTKQCIQEWHRNSSKVWGIRKGPANLFPGRVLPENAAEVFPDLQKGSLGACALVAVADSMLGKKRGPEIDAHDTVFRYNGPIKAYSRDVGTRGDVFYWKQRRDEKQYGVEGQKATKFYMWKDFAKYQMFGDKKEYMKQTFRGKTNLWETHLSADAVSRAYSLYSQEDKKDKVKHASSGGFKLALSVLASGLCTRLDLYGYSSYGGGRYFKNAVVNVVHKIGLEHYVLRTAMEEKFGVCIYD